MTIPDKMTVLKKKVLTILQIKSNKKSKTPVLDNFGRDLNRNGRRRKTRPSCGT
jgi:hypothetical protein